MKKVMRKVLGVLLSTSLVLSPVIQAAGANQFDVAAEDVAGKVLFPGDSVGGIAPVYLGPDGTSQEMPEGTWTNNTSQAYVMSSVESEEGGLWLEPAGYVLTVNGGTSKATGTDGSDTSNHYRSKDGSEETEQKDIAYYQAWSDVTVTANAAPEGQVFDHWEVENSAVALNDDYASETNFTMADTSVVMTAVYAEDVTEATVTEATITEAPVTEAQITEAQITEAPVEETTITEAQITEAPVEETTITEAPIEEIPAEGETTSDEQAIVFDEGETYTLTVENGSGSGEYEMGDEVTITADIIDGLVFTGWTTDADTVWFADASSQQTTFSMPAEPVVVTAAYTQAQPEETQPAATEPAEEAEPEPQAAETTETELQAAETEPAETQPATDEVIAETEEIIIPIGDNAAGEVSGITEETTEEAPIYPDLYTVEVISGEGGGTYEAGAEVTVYADAAPEGQIFAGWTTSENVVLNDPTSEEVTFTMPSESISLTATYKTAETTAPETTAPQTEATEAVTEPVEIIEINTEEETEDVNANGGESEPETQTVTETQPVTEAVTETETDTEGGTEQAATETESETETETTTETETETEMETEQAAPVVYNIDLSSNEDVEVVNPTVDANGLPVAEAGSTVTIRATAYDDKVLSDWEITRSDTQERVAYNDVADDPYAATFIMPNSRVYIAPVYEELNDNEVQVINGTGSGTYVEGDYVEITANTPQTGYRFKNWVVVTGDVELEDASSATTGFTMPAEAVQVKAVYEVIKYTLTVVNGTGSGEYVAGETISLTANYPASGKEFSQWKVTGGSASVASADRYYATITMPAANVTVEATYKDGPSTNDNKILGIEAGAEYLRGTTLTFNADGAGMSNTNPNPGDYRYRPTGYQIGSVSGNWSNAPYSTSMSINATGQYTLNVSYSKDVYDGNGWVADGTTDTKSVTFYVVNALSVQTGDSSPIVPLAIAAVAALLVIILVLVIRKRRRG